MRPTTAVVPASSPFGNKLSFPDLHVEVLEQILGSLEGKTIALCRQVRHKHAVSRTFAHFNRLVFDYL